MQKPLLSICIPTFNRSQHLVNCLHSIHSAAKSIDVEFEVCVSDNCSSDDTESIMENLDLPIPIRYHRNESNVGIPLNFVNVVSMAKGEYAWLIGNDDLLLPDTLIRLIQLLKNRPKVDFFFVNAYHLTTEYVLEHSQPFNTNELPEKMIPCSKKTESEELPFFDLIDPNVSFDFLGGMFLSVFRRQPWIDHVHCLDSKAITAPVTFSHFDNTFPHMKIFAHAFSSSRAYFNAEPMVVCLSGAREWAPLNSMVMNVRLIEGLEIYRKKGLPFIKYVKCRNFALREFWVGVLWMLLNKKVSGLQYLKFKQSFLMNMIYPNFYLSPFIYIYEKVYFKVKRI